MVVYLVSLVLPIAQSILMFRNRDERQAARAARTPRQVKTEKWSLSLFEVGITVLIVIVICVCFDLLHRGAPQGLAMLVAAQLLSMPTMKFLIDHVTLEHVEYQVMSVCVGLLFSSVAFGMSDGNFARYSTYEAKSGRVVMCGDKLVLRRFGENYIAVAPGDAKVVTDLACKVVMTVPSVTGEARQEIHWHPYPHIHYVLEGQPSPAH